ncbi:MAG: hypothetical protein LBR53_07770 [Deltaproteobacteria bacterium]|nr:hypothetical protein [Deltaproteobacteria bacterium]
MTKKIAGEAFQGLTAAIALAVAESDSRSSSLLLLLLPSGLSRPARFGVV